MASGRGSLDRIVRVRESSSAQKTMAPNPAIKKRWDFVISHALAESSVMIRDGQWKR